MLQNNFLFIESPMNVIIARVVLLVGGIRVVDTVDASRGVVW